MASGANGRGDALWDEVRRTARNVRSYVFGRNVLIGFASLMLVVISGFATWSGMSDFIVGSAGRGDEAVKSIGGLTVTNEGVVVAIVVALTFLMWIALRETFGLERSFTERAIMFPLYVFLALWSVGFGYGFWWSLIAGQEATKTSMVQMRDDARDATGSIAARLEAVRIQLDSVVGWSEGQMAREESSGGSCGIRSGAGRGPLYNARQNVRDQIASLRDNIAASWIAPVQTELDELRKIAATAPSGGSLAERQASFEARAGAIRASARSIAARSNELGISTAAEMRALASAVAVRPGEAGFSCYDPTLAQRLSQAAEQAGQPAVLELRAATFNEGPAGVANAVKNLWLNVGAGINSMAFFLSAGLIGSDVGDLDGQPISGRDLIALLATIGVDLGLFALTALNPPPRVEHKLSETTKQHIDDAIRRAAKSTGGKVDREFIRQHIIHHRRKSYLVIPNLYSVGPVPEASRGLPEERAGAPDARATTSGEAYGPVQLALAMNKFAGVLDDLRVVRWPHPPKRFFGGEPTTRLGQLMNPVIGRSELQILLDEERQQSDTQLSDVRRTIVDTLNGNGGEQARIRAELERKIALAPKRNHGVYSKTEVALISAGWSERAALDPEIFVLVDTEGLTPLLEALAESGDDTSGNARAARTQPIDA